MNPTVLCYLAGYRALTDFLMNAAGRSGLLSDTSALRHLRWAESAVLEEPITAIVLEYRSETMNTDLSTNVAPRSSKVCC